LTNSYSLQRDIGKVFERMLLAVLYRFPCEDLKIYSKFINDPDACQFLVATASAKFFEQKAAKGCLQKLRAASVLNAVSFLHIACCPSIVH
jgi:hypothetical protein